MDITRLLPNYKQSVCYRCCEICTTNCTIYREAEKIHNNLKTRKTELENRLNDDLIFTQFADITSELNSIKNKLSLAELF